MSGKSAVSPGSTACSGRSSLMRETIRLPAAVLRRADVEEIWINAPTEVFVARGGLAQRANVEPTDTGVRDLVERTLQSTVRRVDVSSPFVDASCRTFSAPRRSPSGTVMD
jgi:Flp pilus assembly CpaF family ATPase